MEIEYYSPDSRLRHPERNDEADRRLVALGEVREEYEPYDFVVGMTVFGSTVHGKAHEKSDIDTCIFIDPDELRADYDEIELEAGDYRDIARVVERSLAQKIGLPVEELSSKGRCDVRVFPINERIIGEVVSGYEKQMEEYIRYTQEVRRFQAEKSAAGTFSWDTFNDEVREALGDEARAPSVDWSVSKMFHPAVGDQLRLDELRHQVIEAAEGSPYRDEIWSDITFSVKHSEGSMHNDQSLFPDTLEEARGAFKVPNR